MKISVPAYAKINIGLNILGKRNDGYHELLSIFQEINLCDNLHIEQILEKKITLTCSDESIPCDERNTIVKAANMLLPFCKFGYRIYLEKNIPHEAGLGGGSSDAAAILKALNKIESLNLSQEKLCGIALEVGSDVPFFIDGKQALISGRGEIIKAINFNFPYHIIVIKKKNLAFSTKEIYQNFQPFLDLKSDSELIIDFIKDNSLNNLKCLTNDLEKAIKQNSEIIYLKSLLTKNGAVYTSMSGSGSSVYGLFENTTKLTLSNEYLVFTCKALTRS
jgi:4-diphosphocytidyl-2-C-methyl-D-erythritol kinase